MTTASQPALSPGEFVLLSLASPREKFWGVLLELAPAGVTVRGIDLNSFDDFAALVRRGEPASAAIVFFPMHRVERMEIDAPNGDLPSLAQRFEAASGKAAALLLERRSRSVRAR